MLGLLYGPRVTDWLSVGIGVISGLFGGSLGGVLVASRIGERSERGKRRHQARMVLHAELMTYRDNLRYDLQSRDVRPKGYASISSQEHVAEVVLREAPHLGRRHQRRLREDLERLVGPRTVELADARRFMPTDARDHDRETARIDLIDRRIRHDSGEVDQYGQLGLVLRSPNEPDHGEHHAAAMATLQRMLTTVTP